MAESVSKHAAVLAAIIVFGGLILALALPAPSTGEKGPVGADCKLMAQAVAELHPDTRYLMTGDLVCDWQALGLPRATRPPTLTSWDDFYGGTVVERPTYALAGRRATVDVGVQLAPLAGEGQLCSYWLLFGQWHRTKCEASWIS